MIDITVPVSPGLPVWPGDQEVEIFRQCDMEKGDELNLTSIKLSSHTGTHIDAPLHFVKGGKTTMEISPARLMGKCWVADARGLKKITEKDLDKMGIPAGVEKLLFKTDNSLLWENPEHVFNKDYCALTPGAARWVVERNIHLTGIDYASVQLFDDSADVHVILLSNEVVIIENLDLRRVVPGWYRLTCLPLKIKGVEGSPARAVLEVL